MPACRDWRAPRSDIAILLITFLLAVFVDLVVAVNIGVILAMLQFLRKMASSVAVQQLTDDEVGVELGHQGQVWEALPKGVLVYAIDGPFFFGAAETFERARHFPIPIQPCWCCVCAASPSST